MNIPPPLEPRFTEPPGWRWDSFTREGRTIRFGTTSPENTIPDATLIMLTGVREFAEKYFETARWALENNLAVWTFDWAGQGKSQRFANHKRHTAGFAEDLKDLDYFIREHVQPSTKTPVVLLAHSMGANLGLRYLHDHPDTFACAALSAPMIGIKVFEHIPQTLAFAATAVLRLLLPNTYIPGGHDWKNQIAPDEHRLSGDPVRVGIHNLWGEADPDLITGDVTNRWLFEAQKSCLLVQAPLFAQNINTPCVIAIPAYEHLVNNRLSHKVLSQIPNAQILDFPDSYHEVLMERDAIRSTFLGSFYSLIKQTIINCPAS